MIGTGSSVVITTKTANYSPCTILDRNEKTIKVSFFAGTVKDKRTGKVTESHKVESISMRDVVTISERL